MVLGNTTIPSHLGVKESALSLHPHPRSSSGMQWIIQDCLRKRQRKSVLNPAGRILLSNFLYWCLIAFWIRRTHSSPRGPSDADDQPFYPSREDEPTGFATALIFVCLAICLSLACLFFVCLPDDSFKISREETTVHKEI